MNNLNVFILGLVQLFSAVLTGIFILVSTYKIVIYLCKKWYNITTINTSFGIYIACIMFSTGFMSGSVIDPLHSFFRILQQSHSSVWLYTEYFLRGAAFIAIAFISALLITILGSALYSRLTPLKEFEEIKNNNIGVALIMGAIIITLTLLSRGGVSLLLEAIVPYPHLPPR